MSQTIHLEKQMSATAGRYVATVNGVAGEAEITFTVRGPALISADHTGAPDSMRGMGVAAKLVEHMIADARANGFKIVPVCTYVQAQFRKHPEWQDVMAS